MEELWTHIADCSDEEAAGGSALDGQVLGRGVTALDQMLGAGDEVQEGVLLLQVLAVLIPNPAHLAAPPNVSLQGKGEIQEAHCRLSQGEGAIPSFSRSIAQKVPLTVWLPQRQVIPEAGGGTKPIHHWGNPWPCPHSP